MDEQMLREQIQTFIRQFGLLEQEHTPCQYPLSPSQAHALQVLGQREQLPLYQLALHLHLEKSTVSRLVNGLVEHAWVKRNINPENRREVLLRLTHAGRTVFEAVQASASTKYQAIWNRIPVDQRSQVLDVLATLNAILKEEDC